MENKKTRNKGILVASNVFSGMGSAAALCCSGPGIVACSMACAPSCGSVGFSLFGVSSSAITGYLGEYWPIFVGLSIVCFGIAFYRLFLRKDCSKNKKSRTIFIVSLIFSMLIYLVPHLL